MKSSHVFSCVAVFALMAGCTTHTGVSMSDVDKIKSDQADKPVDPPLTADTHFAAGQLAEVQNATPVAIKQYQEALKADPKHLPSMYRLGVLYTQAKDYPKALETWHAYVAASNNAASYANLGFCLELSGDPLLAEEAYKKGLAMDSKNPACRANYGLMLARHQHVEEAIRMWQPVLTDAEIHYNLASVYEMDSRKEQAKTEYRKALAADPKFTDARQRLAALSMD